MRIRKPRKLALPIFSETSSPKMCARKSTATPCPDPLSTRAQRLPAHRPCQGHLSRLRPRRRVWRQNQPALRRHQSRKRRAGIRRFNSDRTSAGSASTGSGSATRPTTFGQLYEWALKLIKDGKAYVDDLTADEIRQHRGTLTEPGKDSPYRNRTIEENLDLFKRMKSGRVP